MKCKKCGGELEFTDTYARGRRMFKVYTCSKCNGTELIKSNLIPNKVGRKF